jgi:hypothetical protein
MLHKHRSLTHDMLLMLSSPWLVLPFNPSAQTTCTRQRIIMPQQARSTSLTLFYTAWSCWHRYQQKAVEYELIALTAHHARLPSPQKNFNSPIDSCLPFRQRPSSSLLPASSLVSSASWHPVQLLQHLLTHDRSRCYILMQAGSLCVC